MARQIITHQGDHRTSYYAIEDGSRCRLVDPTDTSDHQPFTYHPDCGLCWLGYGHSADYHERALAVAA